MASKGNLHAGVPRPPSWPGVPRPPSWPPSCHLHAGVSWPARATWCTRGGWYRHRPCAWRLQHSTSEETAKPQPHTFRCVYRGSHPLLALGIDIPVGIECCRKHIQVLDQKASAALQGRRPLTRALRWTGREPLHVSPHTCSYIFRI